MPLREEWLGRWAYPGQLVGLPESRSYDELACAVYETVEPNAAQLKAVQRAGKRLIEAEMIEGRFVGGEVRVRRRMTEADYEYRAEVERRVQEWKAARADAAVNALDYPVDTGFGGVVEVPVEPVLIIREGGVEVREPL